MSHLLAALVGIAAVVASLPAFADPITDDVHCTIVMAWLAEAPTPQVSASGTIAALYFAGKLYAHSPGLDLDSIALAEAPKLLGPALRAEVARCVQEMRTTATTLKSFSGLAAQSGESAADTAQPAPDASAANLRCVLAYALTAQEAGDAGKLPPMQSAGYFLGKLHDWAAQDLYDRAHAMAGTVSGAALLSEIPRCDVEVKPKNAAIQALAPALDHQLGNNPLLAIIPKPQN